MEAWSKMIQPGIGNNEQKRIANDLRKYCELDTCAMVEIYRFLVMVLKAN